MDGLPLSTLPFLFLLSLSFATLTFSVNVSTLSFDDAYDPLFGDGNLVKSPGGKSVSLILDRRTGSGFISKDLYKHGLFSASIKLPSDYTAGIVVAFYTSNGDVFEKTHDELDFEFLGNIRGKEWRIQTNVYGNGSTYAGREERYLLWFDPSKEFHRYSILWTDEHIVFYIDEVPIREVVKSPGMGGHFPAKPMSLYATIWDASNWATSGGRYKVDYKYAPFVSQFTDLVLQGCAADPIDQIHANCNDVNAVPAGFSTISPGQRSAMRKFRQKYMTYSYCYDRARYPTPLPECVIVPAEQRRFRETGHLKFGGHHRHSKRHSRIPAIKNDHHSSM